MFEECWNLKDHTIEVRRECFMYDFEDGDINFQWISVAWSYGKKSNQASSKP